MYKVSASRIEKLFALALVCSVWTQLRVVSVIGIPELLLLYIGMCGKCSTTETIREYQRTQIQYVKLLMVVIPFGIAWNLLTVNNYMQMAHDLFAFVFVGFLILKVFKKVKIYENLLGILYSFFVFQTIANIIYFGMYAVGMGMYYGERFAGFSSDPNQLGEVLFLVPWMALYFFKKIKEQSPQNVRSCRVICAICVISSIIIGILTESDTFIISSVVALVIYLLMETVKIITTGKGNKLLIVIDIIIIVFFIIKFSDIGMFMDNYYAETAQDANQLDTRKMVWLHGFQAFLHSPIVGNGPGAYSGNWFAFGNMESHNTYIYIMMDYGIIGLFALLSMLFAAWKGTRRAKSSEMSAAFISFLVFNWFHSFHRMPLFWFFIYLFISVGIAEWYPNKKEKLSVSG